MPPTTDTSLVRRKYHDVFGASITPAFGSYLSHGPDGQAGAILGYRRASEGELFLETYLDGPIERVLERAFGKQVTRDEIVEIGNFAADNALAMIELWGAAANDLAGSNEFAVATLTAPLRRTFGRIGIPIVTIAPAQADRLGEEVAAWGRYYDADPWICAGVIAPGQHAIARFLGRRAARKAA